MKIPGPYYQKVYTYVVNPKSVTIGEFYGEIDYLTNEWRDGLIASIIRHACSVNIYIYIYIFIYIYDMIYL